jgi:hypothetical protein
MCRGAESEILDLTAGTETNIAMANHLDSVYHLFDKPLRNNVHTALYSLQDKFSQKGRPVFQEEHYRHLEEFCVMHAKCGLFLRLKLEEDQ